MNKAANLNRVSREPFLFLQCMSKDTYTFLLCIMRKLISFCNSENRQENATGTKAENEFVEKCSQRGMVIALIRRRSRRQRSPLAEISVHLFASLAAS